MKTISIRGIFAEAHHLLWMHGFWRFLLLPILFTPLVMIGLFATAAVIITWLVGMIPQAIWGIEIPEWFRSLLVFAIFMLVAGPLFGLYQMFVLMSYGPFLEKLALEIEKHKGIRHPAEGRTLFQVIKRTVKMFLYTQLVSLLALVLSLLLNMIPVLGFIASGLLSFMAQFLLSTVSFVDPCFDRSCVRAEKSFGLLFSNLFASIKFGALFFVLILIPVVGWFLAPTYSIISGIILGYNLLQNESWKESLISASGDPRGMSTDNPAPVSKAEPQ